MTWSKCSWQLWVEVVHEHQSERKDTPPGNISPTSFRHFWGPMVFWLGPVFSVGYVTVVAWKYIEDDMRIDLYHPGLGPWIKHPTPWAHKKRTAMRYIHPSVVKQSYGFQISDSDTEHDGLWKNVFPFNCMSYFGYLTGVNSQKRHHNQTGPPPKKTTTLHNMRKRYSTSQKINGWSLQLIHNYKGKFIFQSYPSAINSISIFQGHGVAVFFFKVVPCQTHCF